MKEGRSVFIWQNYRRWRPRILRLVADTITPRVVARIKARPPKRIYSDDLTWLQEIIDKEEDLNTDIEAVLIERFQDEFPFVRGYHGCKPADISSYDCGIKLCDTQDLDRQAFELFGDNEKTRAAIADLGGSYAAHNRGKIFFCLDKRHLLNDCREYVFRGSEYLGGIANRIGQGVLLRCRGVPTVISCDLKYEWIDFKKCLVRNILTMIFARLIRQQNYYDRPLNFGFSIKHPVPRHLVVEIEHPKQRLDRWIHTP